MIDVHSLTWKAILKFAESEQNAAIAALIADRDSDKHRGVIAVLNKLIDLPEDKKERIVQDDYTYPA